MFIVIIAKNLLDKPILNIAFAENVKSQLVIDASRKWLFAPSAMIPIIWVPSSKIQTKWKLILVLQKELHDLSHDDAQSKKKQLNQSLDNAKNVEHIREMRNAKAVAIDIVRNMLTDKVTVLIVNKIFSVFG